MKTLRKASSLCVLLLFLFVSACGAPAAATQTYSGADHEYEPAATSAPAFEEPAYSPNQNAQSPTSEAPTDMFFEDYGVNPAVDAGEDNLSTFALDVDTGSYTVMRNYLNDGNLPPADSVRVEEYVNYFDQ